MVFDTSARYCAKCSASVSEQKKPDLFVCRSTRKHKNTETISSNSTAVREAHTNTHCLEIL